MCGVYSCQSFAERKAALVGLALMCPVQIEHCGHVWRVWALGIRAQKVLFLAEHHDPCLQSAEAIDVNCLCHPVWVKTGSDQKRLRKAPAVPLNTNPYLPVWWLDEVPF